VFTARYALSPYIKQICFVFEGLIKVKSCNSLLRMLLVRVYCYPKSVLRYKLLILDAYHMGTTFTWVRMWEFVVIFRSQKESASKESLGSTALPVYVYNKSRRKQTHIIFRNVGNKKTKDAASHTTRTEYVPKSVFFVVLMLTFPLLQITPKNCPTCQLTGHASAPFISSVHNKQRVNV
jgi:hypothetical protein